MFNMCLAHILEHINFLTPIRVASAPLPQFHILGLYIQPLTPVVSINIVLPTCVLTRSIGDPS